MKKFIYSIILFSALLSGTGYANFTGDGGTAGGNNSIAIGSSSQTTGDLAIALGYSTTANTGSIAMGDLATASGTNSISIGRWSSATNTFALAVGVSASASGYGSTAFGRLATATGTAASALGSYSTATGGDSLAAGVSSLASGEESTALGASAEASGTSSFAGGASATASGDYSTAIGYNSSATTANSVAIGSNSSVTVDDGVAIGSNSVASTTSGVTGYLANGNTSSTWVSTASAVSVGDAATGITRQITGVAAGTEDTDAVNVAQLKVVNTKVDDLSDTVSNMYTSLGQDIGRVGAHAAALAALKPLSYDPYQKFQAMVGYGNYKGTNAVAVGFAYNANEDVMFNVGATLENGSHMYNAGVSFRFGKGNENDLKIPKSYQRQGVITSVYKIQQENAQLKETVGEQNNRLTQQDEIIKNMQEQISYLMNKLK